MIDQYMGIKELYEVSLKANDVMQFGDRRVEVGEPVLYFENIVMTQTSETHTEVPARGGWKNMPRVVWADRSEVRFALSEGVLSSISLGILLNAKMGYKSAEHRMLVPKREGPFEPKSFVTQDENNNDVVHYYISVQHWPTEFPEKKTFIFEYDRGVIQKKIYGKRIYGRHENPFEPEEETPCIELFEDKACTIAANPNHKYLIDYYYEFGEEALIYTIQQDRFRGLFTLEGKFYSKDENEGRNYTNILYMPKVRVVSDISLRLGERADPTMSVFNIVGMPVTTTDRKNMILEITRLNDDIDEKEL